MGEAHPDQADFHALECLGMGLAKRALRVQALPNPPDAETRVQANSRAILSDTHLLLPPALDAAAQRAAVAHAAAHWLYSTPHQPVGSLKPMSQIVIATLEDARVERLLADRLPGTRAWFLHELRRHHAQGLGLADLIARLSRALMDDGWIDLNPWVQKARTLFARTADADGLRDASAFRRIGSVLANDLGQMRVRVDLRQWVEPSAYRDDHSWLWRQDRSSDAVLSLATASAGAAAPGHTRDDGPADVARRFVYGEWDWRLHRQRPDWCTVIEHQPERMAEATAPGRGPCLSLGATRAHQRSARLRRQAAGDALDLNACIDFVAERQRGHVGEARLFVRRARQSPTSAVLVLLDLSASTLERAPCGARMLDVAKQAALLLASARSASRRVAVQGFSSDTRQAVDCVRLLDFDEPLDGAALARIRSAPARHSTRLGAALRHAAGHVSRQPAERRAILVVTDGAPADVDVFEPHYLIEDARQAVHQARAAGVDAACLVTDPDAQGAVARMFGAHHWRVAGSLAQLPTQLLALHAVMTR